MSQIDDVRNLVAKKSDTAVELAKNIWGYAELAYKETKSAAAMITAAEREGFWVETGIAGIPTAFTATYVCGSGKPVIGFLAEYDALDGLSQEAANPQQCPITPGGSGHGCGHNLLGSGAWLAAVATKDYLEQNKMDGTVILFGCPFYGIKFRSSSKGLIISNNIFQILWRFKQMAEVINRLSRNITTISLIR